MRTPPDQLMAFHDGSRSRYAELMILCARIGFNP